MTKDKEKKSKLNFILNLISILIIIICLIYIFKWAVDNHKSSDLVKNMKRYVSTGDIISLGNSKIEEYKIDFEELKKENSDTVGWLKVNNTNIDYPIVKTKNNSYYLNHDFNKRESKTGWLWVNYLNKLNGEDKNIVIYGHNMQSGLMFGTLPNILTEEWYNNEENEYITFTTENEIQIYKVFSIYKIENENYYIKNDFNSDEEFIEFVETLKRRSIKKYNIDIESKNFKILTLSTCANNTKDRVVLHAVRVKQTN